MKKILSLFLVLTVFLSVLTACGASPEEPENSLPTVMRVGESKVSQQEYNYTLYSNYVAFYNANISYVSYLGLGDKNTLKTQPCNVSEDFETWADFFMQQTEEMLTQVYTFYNAAIADGMTLNEAYSRDLDAYMLEVQQIAEGEKQTADEFLSANYGAGMTEALYREFLTHRLLATQYCDEKLEAITYSDEKYEEYYKNNKESLDKVTFRIFSMTEDHLPADTSKDDAETVSAAVKDLAELFAKDLTTEEEFIQRALAYAPEEDKESFKQDSATLAQNLSADSFSEEMSAWLFDEARQKGDVTVLKTGETTYNICYFLSCGRDEYPLASMRHLLIQVTDKEGATDAEVKTKIQTLYDDWVAAGAKESEFATLADTHTEDDGSKGSGGLYESFEKATMVPEIDNWLYADGRKVGDHEIIKTTYGYHIVLFMGYGNIAWKEVCYNAFQTEDYQKLFEALAPQNEVAFEENYKDTVANG
ncbi:MAG: peptidylprolyl isomerase [Clostridia bacterium]|nr:peptidylprolyl isomerase [Clostridia bacterium]